MAKVVDYPQHHKPSYMISTDLLKKLNNFMENFPNILTS